MRRAFDGDIGGAAYDACRTSIEQATPVDYFSYNGAERVLGQALLDVLEDGLDAKTALTQAQDGLEDKP